jgi:tetrahydromethanopterin S-methyltransferase subunit A
MKPSPTQLSEPAPTERSRHLRVVREQLEAAVVAKKCHSCGCFHSTVAALEGEPDAAAELSEHLSAARRVFAPTKYDCLGCAVCFPAVAANAFLEAFPEKAAAFDTCPTEAPQERTGWPPLPGDFEVVRYAAVVAVCTLNTSELVKALAAHRPLALSIVGTIHTENLGIERVIKNVLSNPNIRFMVLCGEDTQQAIGHRPGQSLLALVRNGIEPSGRIVGAEGKRPVLKNVTTEEVQAFARQIEVIDLMGDTDLKRVLGVIEDLAARVPAPIPSFAHAPICPSIAAEDPKRLILDPAGFFVVYPDSLHQKLVVEHYTKAGTLDAVIEGRTPAALYTTIAERGLVTRLDHAAYLGCELTRAARSLETGEPYVPDRAAGVFDDGQTSIECGCARSCGGAP